MNGTLSTYGMQAAAPLSAGLSFQSRAAFARASGVYRPDSNDSYAIDVWLPWNFSPFGNGRVWTLTPTAGGTNWLYGAPDPIIDPFHMAHVTEWRVGLGLDVPVYEAIVLDVLALYRADLSNISAFAMRDFSISAGPAIKF